MEGAIQLARSAVVGELRFYGTEVSQVLSKVHYDLNF